MSYSVTVIPTVEVESDPLLLTIREAAKLCGISESTLRRWSCRGLAPVPIRIGDGKRASVRYRLSDLQEWIAGGCQPVVDLLETPVGAEE